MTSSSRRTLLAWAGWLIATVLATMAMLRAQASFGQVHVVLVYGRVFDGWKKGLDIRQVTIVTIGVTVAMLLLSIARLRWIPTRRGRRAAAEVGSR